MKRLLLFVTIAVFFNCIQAQDKVPLINFSTTTHDFGQIKEEEGSVSFDFKLTNTGEVPLIISRVASSCGCATPIWPKEPIAPGGEGVIKTTFNPKNMPGVFNKTITVFSNTTPAATVLTIKGNVIPKPKTLEDTYRRKIGDLGITNIHMSFSRVFESTIATDTLGIYNFGNEPLKISFSRIPTHITISSIPEVLKPEEEGIIVVAFDANKKNDWGFVIDRIRIMLNEENPQGNILNISANIQEDFSSLTEKELEKAPRIEFVETQKDFGVVEEGEVINYDFVFKNTGKSDLIIRKIRASCGCTTVAPKVTVIKPGEESSLSASFRTSGFSGRQSKSVTVITNDPKTSTQVLRLSGTVNKKE